MKTFHRIVSLALVALLSVSMMTAISADDEFVEVDVPTLIASNPEDADIMLLDEYVSNLTTATPSPTAKEDVESGTENVVVTPWANIDTLDDVSESDMEIARDEMNNKLYETAIPDFADIWDKATGGAPLETVMVAEVFDVTGEVKTFTVTFNNVELTESNWLLIHKQAGQWIVEDDATYIGDNTLQVTVDSYSPFALLVVDTSVTPVINNDKQSPKTGDEETDTAEPELVTAVTGEADTNAVESEPAEATTDAVTTTESATETETSMSQEIAGAVVGCAIIVMIVVAIIMVNKKKPAPETDTKQPENTKEETKKD